MPKARTFVKPVKRDLDVSPPSAGLHCQPAWPEVWALPGRNVRRGVLDWGPMGRAGNDPHADEGPRCGRPRDGAISCAGRRAKKSWQGEQSAKPPRKPRHCRNVSISGPQPPLREVNFQFQNFPEATQEKVERNRATAAHRLRKGWLGRR